MASHPEVLAKCQQEADSICGPERSPSFKDMDKFTYLRCTMNEVRIATPVPGSQLTPFSRPSDGAL